MRKEPKIKGPKLVDSFRDGNNNTHRLFLMPNGTVLYCQNFPSGAIKSTMNTRANKLNPDEIAFLFQKNKDVALKQSLKAIVIPKDSPEALQYNLF